MDVRTFTDSSFMCLETCKRLKPMKFYLEGWERVFRVAFNSLCELKRLMIRHDNDRLYFVYTVQLARPAYVMSRDETSGSSFRLCGTRSLNPTTPSHELCPRPHFPSRASRTPETPTPPLAASLFHTRLTTLRFPTTVIAPASTSALLPIGRRPLHHLHRNGDLQGASSVSRIYLLLDIHP